jgi:HAD superfamily hydrolase (TIGR01509 family)
MVRETENGEYFMSQPESRSFEAILFDLYDTLVWLDVEQSDRGRRELARRIGVPLERFLPAWRSSVNDRMIGRGNGLAGHLADTLALLGIEPDQALVSELIGIEQSRLRESVHLYPSTVSVLEQLARAGYRLGLLSNVSDGAALPITHLGLDRLFDEMILSHEVGLLKPDPAIFELACKRLGVTPVQTMFVADGGFGELDSAHRLGIFSVIVEQDNQSKDFGSSSEYDLKIHDLSELEQILPKAAMSDQRTASGKKREPSGETRVEGRESRDDLDSAGSRLSTLDSQ